MNKENLHTPGPWTCDSIHPDNGRTQIGSPKDFICELYTYGIYSNGGEQPTESEQQANARLIAAAPELLEALKEAQKLLHPLVMKMNIRKHFHEHNVLANVIVKAIAKATEGQTK